MKKVLIGIAGTHSTGKSSFCEALYQNLLALDMNVSKIPSFGKLAMELGIPLLKEHTFESTLWFINKTLDAKKNAIKDSDIVIVERPEIDSFSYWKAAMSYNQVFFPEEKKEIESLILEHTKSYTHLFATKLDPLIPLAPGRDADLEFREAVDYHLHLLIKSIPNKTIMLRSDEHQATILKLSNEITTSLRS